MARKKPKVSLGSRIPPQTGDLEKLFGSDDDVEQAAGLILLSLKVDAIQPDPNQPRNSFPEDSLAELAESIRQDGIIQP
ncbi:MAG: ParB N-terminal domain-containing protein, partial [Anaerolineales bacterium]|nr:ParB N-terminal domain-containing protein [Anaerolineales bacterium]